MDAITLSHHLKHGRNVFGTLIEVKPGEFRAVWDSGTPDKARAHIHFGKFKLKL